MPKASAATPTTITAATNNPRNPKPIKRNKSFHPQGVRKSSGIAGSNCDGDWGAMGGGGIFSGEGETVSSGEGGTSADTSLGGSGAGADAGIGRAAGRERVEISVGARSFK